MGRDEQPKTVAQICEAYSLVPERTRQKDKVATDSLALEHTPIAQYICRQLQQMPEEELIQRGKRFAPLIMNWENGKALLVGFTQEKSGQIFGLSPTDPGLAIPVGEYGERFARTIAISAIVIMKYIQGMTDFFNHIDKAFSVINTHEMTFSRAGQTHMVGVEVTAGTIGGLLLAKKMPGEEDAYNAARIIIRKNIPNTLASTVGNGRVQPDIVHGSTDNYEGNFSDAIDSPYRNLLKREAKGRLSRLAILPHGLPTTRHVRCPAATTNVIPPADIPGISDAIQTKESAIDMYAMEIVRIAELFGRVGVC